MAMDRPAFLAHRGSRRAEAGPAGHRASESGIAADLTANAAGAVIATHTLTHAGDYECAQVIPAGDEVLVEFELDRALPADATDGRERAILVRGIELG